MRSRSTIRHSEAWTVDRSTLLRLPRVRLIDDLLDVSGISQNKMELRRTRLLLTDVVSSAMETALPAIEAGGHEFTISLPPEPDILLLAGEQ